MSSRALPIALSEGYNLVWAGEASEIEEYSCARCGEPVNLDRRQSSFIHPASPFCSALKSHACSALLYLKTILQRPDARVQLLRDCTRCGSHVLDDLRGETELLRSGDGQEALLIDSAERTLLVMRPGSTCARKLALAMAARYIEVDARNVLAGSPIAVLATSSAPLCCRSCA
jgi:DNA-directed RNA polymerase subunit RPC12/RpoP